MALVSSVRCRLDRLRHIKSIRLLREPKLNPLNKAKAIGTKHIAAIDPVELAVRIVEASAKIKRPHGKTARECLDGLPAQDREDVMRAANAAMEYWRECIQQMQQTN